MSKNINTHASKPTTHRLPRMLSRRRTAPAPTPPLGTVTAETSTPRRGSRRQTSACPLATKVQHWERAAGGSLRSTPQGPRRASRGRRRERSEGPTPARKKAPSSGSWSRVRRGVRVGNISDTSVKELMCEAAQLISYAHLSQSYTQGANVDQVTSWGCQDTMRSSGAATIPLQGTTINMPVYSSCFDV